MQALCARGSTQVIHAMAGGKTVNGLGVELSAGQRCLPAAFKATLGRQIAHWHECIGMESADDL